MSESFVRKVQPFTIGTRLSVSGPATRSKGPNFPQQPSWQSDRVSLYLSQVQVSVATPHLAPLANRTTPTSGPVKQQQEDISTQDHRNQNAMSHRSSVSPTATSRSIRKITISGSPEKEDSSWRRQEESDHRVVIEKEDSSWRRQEESDHRVVIEKEDSSWRRQEESDHRVVIEKEDSSWRRQEESDHRVVIEKEDSSWRRQEESDHRVVSIGPEPGRHPVTGTPGSENIIINNINNNNSSKLPRIVGVSCENKPSSHFKQGRGLIRAQHPGNSKIQDFLIRLEELWEELRRRHHRNQVYLQAGEEMSFRTVQLLQALGSIEAWLEAAELSMSNSQLAGDTETMRLAERDSCLLQTEMSCRGMELTALRQEMDRLGGQREGQCPGYPNTEGLQVPQHHTQVLPDLMDQVERKYQRVQNTLTQQSSSLQDTRMLTEFLETVELEERVELEETQEARGWGYSSNLGQPLHSEISSALTLLGDGGGSDGGEPLKEPLGNPVEELREAVEMLNDTVRERGRSQNHIHDQAIQTMIRQLAVLSVRVEDSLCCSRELNLDLLQREKDMAMRCEPERCGLEGLEEQQDHLEVNYAVLKEEVEELQRQTDYLEELCPERVTFLGVEVQGALGVWRELRRNVEENRDRLRQFVHLQDFFRTYLAMISWMEDTRECIFSERVLHCGRDDQEPMAVEMEMDVQIDRKLEELEELDAAGRNLLNAEHHLANMDNNMTSAYESILLPRLHTKTSSSSSPSSSSSSSSSSSGPPHPCVSFSSSLPKNTSIFSSLKRRSKKKRRRKRDAGRHTIQKIMVVEGEEQIEVACPAEAAPQPITLYDTQTWPMKEGRRKKKSLLKAEGVGPGQGVELVDYMDNPLARDIEDECSGVYTVSPYAVTEAVSIAPPRGQVRSHCRFLSLGSVLTFDLSKDMRLIPSIQDVITIGLPEHRGTPNPNLNPNPHTETHAALSSFKHTRSSPSDTHRAPDNEAVTTDRYETMTQIQTQPLLTQTHPLMTQIQTQPLLTQTHPLMTQIQTQPLLTQIQTQPLLTQIQTQPLLTQIQAHPLLTQIQTQPPLTQIQTRPLPTQIQTQPLMTQIQTQPPLTQIQTRPLPTQIQTQPPLTQIQTRPILTQIQTRPLMTQIQTRPILTQIQTQPLPTQIQTQPPLTQIQTRPLPTQIQTRPLPTQIQTRPLPTQIQTETQIQTRPLPTQIQTETQTQTRPLPTQIQTRPLPTQIQTQPLPTQIQTQPLQTQIQTQILKQTKPQTQAIQMEPLSNLDTDFPPPPALDEDWDQNVPSDDLSLSQIQTVHQEPEQEWSEFVSSKQPPITAYCPKSPVPMNRDHYNYMERAMVSRSPIVKSKDSSPSSAYQNHESLIQDLNRHQYHHRLKTHRASVDLQETCQASQMVVDLKISGLGSMMEDSMDSGISGVSNSGSLKLNAPDVPQEPRPRRTVLGRLVSLEVGRMEAVSRPRENPAATTAPAHPETKTTPRNRHPDHQTETELDSDPVHPDLIVHPDHQTETELNSDPVHPDLIVHPDHQQFEELEEELEDIWNHSNGYRQSISSDIMYQPHQEEGGSSNPPGLTTDPLSPPQDQPQAPPYRKLITASAPNLIVAEFTLPSSLQTLLGYNQDQGFSQDPNSREELPILANRDRRSWAAFPVQDQPWRTTALVNETAEDPVKLPEIEDQKRYIYQYREEEEEEVEEDEEEKMEDTGGPKDPSMSLLSVHMGLDRSNQRADCCVTLEGVMEKQGESLATGGRCGAMVRDQEQQGQKLATGGRCGTMVRDQEQQGQKLATGGRCGTMNGSELQTMEGTLERKHTLQLGGKKARSRAWSSHHAVLYKQTLCFYQDSKDTLRNCVCGLSLTLTGAECVSAPENTKKPQCFSLRLRDGSEYLLNTATRFMMKKWMLTIQANTVASEHVSSMASPSDHLVQDPPASFLSRSTHTGKARAKEIVVLTRETPRQIPQWHPEKQQDPTSSSHTDRREDNYDSLRHKLCGSSRENSPSSLHSSIPPFSLHSSVSPPFSSVSPPFSSVSPPFSSVYRGGQDWLSQVNKCHSFTSARYQKIKAALLPPGGRGRDYGSVGQDCVSNYSVTMIIGDKQCAASPTLSCDGSGPSITSHTDPQRPLLDGWQLHSYHQDSLTRRQRHQHQAMYHQDQEPSLRGCTSLPPPRNKSVFNKFFGKKD
ncbi:uncharacterized protein [Salvelinus alpinus]|uniref:uncharacterized protein isoform X9 n=1 Tax=Salvelinus alpinus TaxID=8036 RepID=UPI0039FBA995